MAITYEVVNGKLVITQTRPPNIRRINKGQLTRRVDQMTAQLNKLDERIALDTAQANELQTSIDELTPYIGQL
jgi:hypothetical protein